VGKIIEDSDKLFDASRRYLRCYYTRSNIVSRINCNIDDFLDVIFFNLEALMKDKLLNEIRYSKNKVYRALKNQPIVYWSSSLDVILDRHKEAEVADFEKRKRKIKRNIFSGWRVIVSQLYYYKVHQDNKATRKILKRFSTLKSRNYSELEAYERATDGDLNLILGKAMKQKDVSKSIQMIISGTLPLLHAKYHFRSKHIDRMFQELNKL